MNEIATRGDDVPPALVQAYEEFAAQPDDALRTALQDLLYLSRENVIRMAAIVRILCERKVELRGVVPETVTTALLRIAYGQVVPELLATAWLPDAVVKRAMLLPLPQQLEIAADKPLEVYEIGSAEHGPEPRMVRPSEMSPRQAQQVFGAAGLRTPQQQVEFLKHAAEKQATRDAQVTPVVAMKRERCIMVRAAPTKITLHELKMYVRELGG